MPRKFKVGDIGTFKTMKGVEIPHKIVGVSDRGDNFQHLSVVKLSKKGIPYKKITTCSNKDLF